MATTSSNVLLAVLILGVTLMAVPSTYAVRCGATLAQQNALAWNVASEADWTTFKSVFAKGGNGGSGNCDEFYPYLTITAWNAATVISFPIHIKKLTLGVTLIANETSTAILQNQLTANFPEITSTEIIEVLVRAIVLPRLRQPVHTTPTC